MVATPALPYPDPTTTPDHIEPDPTTTPGHIEVDASHPRLFFTADTVAALRSSAETTHQHMWEPVQSFVQTELDTTGPHPDPPDSTLSAYRNAGNRMLAFAFACVVTDTDDECNLAIAQLLAHTTWDEWGNGGERGLALSHMLLGNAIAYDWLYPRLSPDERQAVRESLARHTERLYQASVAPSYDQTWNNWWRKSYIQNHYWTTHSALGVAALALLGEDERADLWLEHAQRKIERVQVLLNGIDDGSWHESISYHTYGLTMLLPFLVNLRTLQGVDMFPHSHLRSYTDWRVYNYLSNGEHIMAYGDFEWAWGQSRSLNVLRFVAREYDSPYAQWVADQIATTEGRGANVWGAGWYALEFLFYDPAVTAQAPDDLAGAHVFTDLEGVIWRTGWSSDELVFGLKTGAFGGRFAFDTFVHEQGPWDAPCAEHGCDFNADHDHADANTFYLYRAGQWLAPEHEGNEKYASRFHNTILVDGQGQFRMEEQRLWNNPDAFANTDGFLEATASTPAFNYVAADATSRYPDSLALNDFTRHVVFVRPGYFVMLDNLAASVEHTYEWLCHADERLEVEANWIRSIAGDGQILGIAVVAPDEFATTLSNERNDEQRPFVSIRPASPVDSVRMIHLLYPTSEADWPNRPQVELLADTDVASALRVQVPGTAQRTDDIVITHAQPITHTTVAGYQYDGQAAVVARAADGSLERLFVAGATFLSDQGASDGGGRQLVANLDGSEPFEAVYRDDVVAVAGTIHTEVTLYAPQAQQLTVNGVAHPFTRTGDSITITADAKNAAAVQRIIDRMNPPQATPLEWRW